MCTVKLANVSGCPCASCWGSTHAGGCTKYAGPSPARCASPVAASTSTAVCSDTATPRSPAAAPSLLLLLLLLLLLWLLLLLLRAALLLAAPKLVA